MCCEDCPQYERCSENNQLRGNCCLKCPEYYSCVGADEKEDLPGSSGDDFDSEE